MGITDEILVKKVKQSILSIDKDAELILFGSRARPDSDWDFLFLTNLQVTNALREILVSKMLDFELDERAVIQVIPKNANVWETKHFDSPLYRNIKDDGIRL